VNTRDTLVESIRRVRVFAEAAERSRLRYEKLQAEKAEAAKVAEKLQEEKTAEEAALLDAKLVEEERLAKEEQANLEEAVNNAVAIGAKEEIQQVMQRHLEIKHLKKKCVSPTISYSL